MTRGEYKYQSDMAMTPIGDNDPMERRHTNILAADMAGYSRWMADDEEGLIRRLRWVKAKIIVPSLTEHGGRIVRVMGDGLLVEFFSSVAALKASIYIQQTLASLDLANQDSRRLRFRIGLNSGDVVVDGDDLLGDSVNIAARLESIAPVGGICLSRVVYDSVFGKVEIPMEALGAQSLKNIPKPVEVWQIAMEGLLLPTTSGVQKSSSLVV